jgi:chemotaxis family two-component system sensor kinase Cph1
MGQRRKQSFQPGDHVCGIYSTTNELIAVTTAFLSEGLARRERCWYVARGRERYAIADALRKRHVNVEECLRSGALRFAAGTDAYLQHGRFDPERTLDVFNDAIDQASHDGWTGFRAAAEMSWALGVPYGTERVIAYEALLKSLFRSARATGLCLYPRRRMPLRVLNGALITHPIVGTGSSFQVNRFYEPGAARMPDVSDKAVWAKLQALGTNR